MDNDLSAAVSVTALLALFTFLIRVALLQQVLGVVFFFFVPGYLLVTIIFPSRSRPRLAVKLGLAFGLSIVAGVFLGLLLAVTPPGFTLASARAGLLILTGVLFIPAWYRRRRWRRTAATPVPSPAFSPFIRSFRNGSRTYRAAIIGLLVIIVGGLGTYVYLNARPAAADPFTEFYLLGPGGQAQGYPTNLKTGEAGYVIVGIENHENRTVTYRLEVTLAGTTQTTMDDIVVEAGTTWRQKLQFVPTQPGQREKLEFLLYQNGNPTPEMRYLWLNVGQGAG